MLVAVLLLHSSIYSDTNAWQRIILSVSTLNLHTPWTTIGKLKAVDFILYSLFERKPGANNEQRWHRYLKHNTFFLECIMPQWTVQTVFHRCTLVSQDMVGCFFLFQFTCWHRFYNIFNLPVCNWFTTIIIMVLTSSSTSHKHPTIMWNAKKKLTLYFFWISYHFFI